MSHKSNKFRKGDVVRLVSNKNMCAPVGALAIVTGRENEYIKVAWLHYGQREHNQNDGCYYPHSFSHVNHDFNAAPFRLGDVVEVKRADGETGLCLVVMTDWHRNMKTDVESNKTLLRSVMCDGNDSGMWEEYDKRYTGSPSFVYVVPITRPGEDDFTGPFDADTVKLVIGNDELIYKTKENK